MNLTPDDPKLTAYALGELEAPERAAVEAALARSPECRRAVAEIQALSTELTAELAQDAVTAKLSPAAEPWTRAGDLQSPSAMSSTPDGDYKSPALAAVADAPGEGKVIFLPWRHWRTLGMAAAAALVVGFFVTKAWQREQPKPFARAERREVIPLNRPPNSAPATQTHDRTPSPQPPPNQAAQPTTPTVLEAAPNATITVTRTNGSTGVVSVDFGTANGTAVTGVDYFSVNRPDVGLGDFTSYNTTTRNRIAQPSADALFDRADARVLAFSAATYSVNESILNSPEAVNRFGGNPGQVTVHFSTADGKGARSYYAGIPPGSVPPTSPNVSWGFRPDGTTTAAYPRYVENPFTLVASEPLSTFSTDVDTASYANVRRFLNQNQLPPRDAVRLEELLNYFTYDYAPPTGEHPFAAHVEVAGCPWAPEHRLVRVGLKGRELKADKRPPSNFVFLIDVSGSMSPVTRLPLIKQSLRQLVKRMTENDRVAMVVYASSSGTVLESTSAVNKEVILAAIDRLEAGGSTNGGEGIQRAYDLAVANFIKGGVNRVLLCTDGDFNVGITDRGQLLKLIEEKAKSGVFLTTLGVGDDNLKDATLQQLADRGNGNYHYLDTVEEGHKVLVEQMNATLVTIAKDVKIQIEFNPAQASAYRLIGYEKRILAKEDFNNDAKDAGELGAGHTVTALYEVVPPGVQLRGDVDPLKYQQANQKPTSGTGTQDLLNRQDPSLTTVKLQVVRAALQKKIAEVSKTYLPTNPKVLELQKQLAAIEQQLEQLRPISKELFTLKLRYKAPDGDKSTLMEIPVTDSGAKLARASADFKFASAVVEFGMLLKDSPFKGTATFDSALELAGEGKGDDTHGYRAEFINLLGKAKALKK